MSHLYIECLCPSAHVLTLGPLTCQSLQGLKSVATYTSMAIKLQSLLSMECRVYRGLHCLAINSLAAPSTVASAFPSAKKGTTLFPPQGETLPHDCHPLAQFLPCSGISRQLPGHPCGPLVALSGRTSKSQLCSNQSHPLFQLHPTKNSVNAAAWWAGSHWAPAHISFRGLGKGPVPFRAARKRVEGTCFHHSNASQRRSD